MEYQVCDCEQMVKIIIEPLPSNFVQTHPERFAEAHSNRKCNVDRTALGASCHPWDHQHMDRNRPIRCRSFALKIRDHTCWVSD